MCLIRVGHKLCPVFVISCVSPVCFLKVTLYNLLWVRHRVSVYAWYLTQSKQECYEAFPWRHSFSESEHAFGPLKGRWQILMKRNDSQRSNIKYIVTACFVLHNFCENFNLHSQRRVLKNLNGPTPRSQRGRTHLHLLISCNKNTDEKKCRSDQNNSGIPSGKCSQGPFPQLPWLVFCSLYIHVTRHENDWCMGPKLAIYMNMDFSHDAPHDQSGTVS